LIVDKYDSPFIVPFARHEQNINEMKEKGAAPKFDLNFNRHWKNYGYLPFI